MEFLAWFTRFENTKPLSLVIFFLLFCGVLIYLFGNRERGRTLETHKHIPLLDEQEEAR